MYMAADPSAAPAGLRGARKWGMSIIYIYIYIYI